MVFSSKQAQKATTLQTIWEDSFVTSICGTTIRLFSKSHPVGIVVKRTNMRTVIRFLEFFEGKLMN